MELKCLTVALSHRRVVPKCVILKIPNKALGGSCHPFQGIQQPTEALKEFGQQEAVKEKYQHENILQRPFKENWHSVRRKESMRRDKLRQSGNTVLQEQRHLQRWPGKQPGLYHKGIVG